MAIWRNSAQHAELDEEQRRRAFRRSPDFKVLTPDDESRKSRRNLLAAFAIWVLVVPLGFAPRKIQALDIDLSSTLASTTTLASAALLYFWFSFIVYNYRFWTSFHGVGLDQIERLNFQIAEKTSDLVDVRNFLKKDHDPNVAEDAYVPMTWSIDDGHKSGDISRKTAKQMARSIPAEILAAEVERRRIRRDFYARYFWEYAGPALLVFAALYGLTAAQFR